MESTSSSSSTCHCEDVCHCGLGEYYGEGGGASLQPSTVISWQHFPPSTSSPDRCDDSCMEPEFGPSLPESSCKDVFEEEGNTVTSDSSTRYPIDKSISQMNAEHYLKIRHIYELFNFLIGHLVCAEPDDPVAYLQEILDKCIDTRDCLGEEPLLVNSYHLKSLYDTFDPFGTGFITIDQYTEAMKDIGIAAGITPYNKSPPMNEERKIEEQYFIDEAQRCLKENLKKMLRIPKDWEENRLVWKKVMLRRFMKWYKRKGICKKFRAAAEGSGECTETSSYASACNCGVMKVPCPQRVCTCPPKLRHEPEQLFLNDY